jgi:hypothetical protein
LWSGFQGQEIDAYRVRAWHSSIAKPSIQNVVTFMDKLVELGYASPNGKRAGNIKLLYLIYKIGQLVKLPSRATLVVKKLVNSGQRWSKILLYPKERRQN